MKKLIFINLLIFALWQTSFSEKNNKCFNFNLKPSIFNQAEDDKFSGGLEFNFSGNYQPYTGEETTYRKAFLLKLNSAGLLSLDKKLNPQNVRGEFFLGGAVNLSGPQISERGEQEGEEIITQKAFDYGRINGGLNTGYEADQSLDNRNITAGAELTYVYIKNQGFKAIIPSFHTFYEYIKIDKTPFLIDEKNYYRFRMSASWKIPIGEYFPNKFKPLSFHLDARYFKAFDRSVIIENDDLDQSHYIAVFLNYTFNKPQLFGFITGVFVKVSDGRIPPAIKEASQVHLGIIFLEK